MQKKAPGFWQNERNQREALNKLGKALGIKRIDDWYKVSSRKVSNLSFIHDYYNNSLYGALKHLFPHHNWDPLRFSKVPQGFWRDKATQKETLERVGKELGVKELDDWYKVSAKQVQKRASFILYYGSFYEALKELYPHHDWDPLRFTTVPRGYWSSEDNQKHSLERIGKELGVRKLDDWYNFQTKTVYNKTSFINYYGSLFAALQRLYPEHDWDPLAFTQVPRGFWMKEETKRHFQNLFNKWRKEYNIKELNDWYQLAPKQVKIFQRVAVGVFGTVTKMLEEWFPDTNWIAQMQASTPELDLQWMMNLVADIQVHHKIGKHSVDIYVPEWKLALEYQGGQHFKQTWHGDVQSQIERDKRKEQFMQEEGGVSLVTIPHLWNGSWSQLRATIRTYPNPFPENLTLEEVTEAVRGEKFFKKLDWDSFVTFDYNNSEFPMLQFRRVFQDPNTASDPLTKRKLQIYRGLKFSKTGEMLSRPFHKFFNINEIPEVNKSSIDLDRVECILEKYDGKLVTPVKLNSGVEFLSRGGNKISSLQKLLSTTNHEYFAEHIISQNKTPIFEYISKDERVVVKYSDSSLILLAIRDNLTGEYMSYQQLKEEAAAFNIVVAKEWPVPMNTQKLDLMKDMNGVEGFVIKMDDGTLIKWKTDWWRKQRWGK